MKKKIKKNKSLSQTMSNVLQSYINYKFNALFCEGRFVKKGVIQVKYHDICIICFPYNLSLALHHILTSLYTGNP